MEDEARDYLLQQMKLSSEMCFKSTTADWNYATKINNKTEQARLKAILESAAFTKEMSTNLISRFPKWNSFKDADLRRMMKMAIDLGSGALSQEQLEKVYTKRGTF